MSQRLTYSILHSPNLFAEIHTFSAKEKDTETGLSYFGSRYYSSDLSIWLSVDPMSDKYSSMSPYIYCANNPVRLVDPNGEDWYENESGEIKWTDHKNQEQMDENNINGRYLGETVVLFEGSTDEKLGKSGYLDGEGAVTAKVTVYGKSGSDDIDNYIGFTMSSDYEKYGAIADGYYNVEYDENGKSGAIPSHYAVEGRKPVDCLNGRNNSWYNNIPDAYSETQKDGIFVHRTNNSGFAGGNVSTGCPLILANQWDRFEKQVGKNGFSLIIKREHPNKEPKCILK